jgi:hypothetical protein
VIIWEKELQVKEKKIKQQAIKLVEDAEDIVTIDKNDIALIVVSEELQSYGNQQYGIDFAHLMAIRVLLGKTDFFFF